MEQTATSTRFVPPALRVPHAGGQSFLQERFVRIELDGLRRSRAVRRNAFRLDQVPLPHTRDR